MIILAKLNNHVITFELKSRDREVDLVLLVNECMKSGINKKIKLTTTYNIKVDFSTNNIISCEYNPTPILSYNNIMGTLNNIMQEVKNI